MSKKSKTNSQVAVSQVPKTENAPAEVAVAKKKTRVKKAPLNNTPNEGLPAGEAQTQLPTPSDVSVVLATPTVESVQQPPTESDDQSKHRVYKSCGLRVLPARVRTHFDEKCVNSLINEVLNPIKEKIVKYDKAKQALESGLVKSRETTPSDETEKAHERFITDEERTAFQATVSELESSINSLRENKDSLNKEKVRFNNESCLLLSFACDYMVDELVSFAKSLLGNSKRLSVELFLREGVEKLSSYSLFRELPSFLKERSVFERQEQDLRIHEASESSSEEHLKTIKDLKKMVEKSAKKIAKLSNKSLEEVSQYTYTEPKEAPKVPEPVDESHDAVDNSANECRATFVAYVTQVCKDQLGSIKMRVDKSVKELLSNLVTELIVKVSTYIKVFLDLMRVKTVTETLVFKALEAMLSHYNVHSYELSSEQVVVYDKDAVKEARRKALENSKDVPKSGAVKVELNMESLPSSNVVVYKKTVRYENESLNQYLPTLKQRLESCSNALRALSAEQSTK